MAATSLPYSTVHWQMAFAVAALGHLALGAAIVLQRSEAKERVPDPVMVVELPAGIPASAPAPAPQQAQPQTESAQQSVPRMVAPRLDVPQVEAPLLPVPVVVPSPRVMPAVPSRAAPAPATASAAQSPADNNNAAPSGDPRAREARDDWYALIFADLARKKRYPREARQAGQEGTPTVRFTVNAKGRVSNILITRSSGHDLLDRATIELIRRATPLPPMPRAMGRDSVTMSLPIEYELDRG